MKTQTKKLPKNQIEITVELEATEIQSQLEKAASRLSSKSRIDGFRPGKAPFDIVKQKFGEGAILEEALNDIVSATYIKAISKEKLEPIDTPKIDIVKLAPGNPIIYKATVSLLPKINICEINKIKVEKKEVKIDEKKIDSTIKNLAESRRKEKLVNREVQDKDIVEINMELLKNNVPIEGGIAKGHKVIMGEPHYVPGFDKKLLKLKKGDKKEFEINFPKDHYNKQLAGKPIKCRVEILGVYEKEIPKIDDEFAKTLGKFKDLKELRNQIKANIEKEAKMKEQERQEIEMLEKLTEKSTFDEIPEILLKEESRKMIAELEGNLANQGIKFQDYLTHLKKSEEEMKKEFLPQAKKRVKIALLLRKYAEEKNINVSEKDIDEEVEKITAYYPNDLEVQNQIRSEHYRNYLKNTLTNKKVINILKKDIIK